MLNRRQFLVGTAGSLLVLSTPHIVFGEGPKPPVVYTGGPIFTMDDQNAIVEAVAVLDGKIMAVGRKADVLTAAGEHARVIDLAGKALLPGFIEGHSHFGKGAEEKLSTVVLSSPPMGSITCIAELQEALRKRCDATPPGVRVDGSRYNDLGLAEQRHPTREELDAVSTKHPIVITHISGHVAVANSLAFKMAGVTPQTKPQEGVLRVKDGQLTGVMEGWAKNLLNGIPQVKVGYEKCVPFESQIYAASGTTTANNGGSPSIDDYLINASKNNELKVRVVVWPKGMDTKLIASYGDKRSGSLLDHNGRVILGAAKLFADGSPQGYTALFSKPYYKQLTGRPADYRGFSYFPSDEVRMQRVKELHDAGWQIATHTNGDQAIDDMIEAYGAAIKANPRQDHRHILNHCQFNRPDQVPVMAELGLIPSYFVTHTYFWGDVHRDFVAGPEMAAHISPCRQAKSEGIRFALHNDTPVTPISPIMDIFSAVNRVTSSGFVLGDDQRVTVMDALRGVTIDSARMYFLEDRLGSLEKGKVADMVILDKNPLEVPPLELKDLKVMETIVNGETVYKA